MNTSNPDQIFAFAAVAVLFLGAANVIASPVKASPYAEPVHAKAVDPAARVQAFLRR